MAITFNGKRVALIGPAKHVTEIDQKDYISSFDLVVRFNCVFPMPEKLKEKTTDRCDVLYVNRRIVVQPEWQDVKEIRLKLDALWGFEWFVKTREGQRRFKKKIAVVHPDYEFILMEKVGCTPNIGFMAMCEILDQNPKELYITGFTFQSNVDANGYYDGYNISGRVKAEGRLSGFINHDQKKQLDYFIKNIYSKVKVDKVLEKIVNEN